MNETQTITGSPCGGCGQLLTWVEYEDENNAQSGGDLLCFNDECSWEDPEEFEKDLEELGWEL